MRITKRIRLKLAKLNWHGMVGPSQHHSTAPLVEDRLRSGDEEMTHGGTGDHTQACRSHGNLEKTGTRKPAGL